MFPKKGNNSPNVTEHRLRKLSYADAVANGLRAELGDSHRAVKTVMRWTHANERTIKNWFAAKRGPRGEHLLALIQHSDEVLEVILRLARRDQLIDVKLLADARDALAEMLTRMDDYLKRSVSRPQ